jgi:hypothetical protein
MSCTTFTPPGPNTFSGMTPAALQAALTAAQNALIALASGQRAAMVTYAMGDGTRSVTYTRTDEGKLRQLINELQQALGMPCTRRRPMRFRFA